MQVAIALFPGNTALDSVGPYEVLQRIPSIDVVFVGHGHFSRAVATRWVEQPLREGARYGFTEASLAICGFEHGLRQLSTLGLRG